MAIGGANNSTSRIATELFGSVNDVLGGGDASSVFSAGGGNSRQFISASIKGLERELNNLNGVKTDLTQSERATLQSNEAEIKEIESRAGSAAGLSERDVQRRAELFTQSFEILGKPFIDKDADPRIQSLSEQVDQLLEPKLTGPRKERLENLRRLEENALSFLERNPNSNSASLQFRNIRRQISELTPPRSIEELSPSERREYDGLVSEINDLANTEFLLPSDKRIRAEQLQVSISQLKAQEAAFGEPQFQPTPGEAARAYRG